MGDVDDRWFKKVNGEQVKSERHGSGKRWVARWRDESKKQRSKAFARKIDAEAYLSVMEADTMRGTYVSPDAGRLTFRVYAERRRAILAHRASTQVQVESHLRRHVYPILGNHALGAVRPSDIQAWLKRLGTAGDNRKKALAPGTVLVVYRYVSGIFRAAVADRLITSSPCIGITLPAKPPKRVWPPAKEHVTAMIDAAEDRYRALLVLGAGTGIRLGEALGLELENVDFLRRTLTVRQQLASVPKRNAFIGIPKTPSSYRTIPLSPKVIEALAEHVRLFPPVPVEIVDTTGGSGPVTRTAHLLFTSKKKRPLRGSSFSCIVWLPARAKTTVPATVTFHSLRHYFASALIQFGESVKVVQARLGHASAAETLDTYAHLWPDMEDRTREAVDIALAV
jgi:integrase